MKDFKDISSEQLKNMSARDLDMLAVRIREALIDSVSKTGGHLASNLGTVELTIALHRIFDVHKDRIVWDVGHQCYVHKMLTGRWGQMDTLRKRDGLSGFPKRAEDESDCYDSGHSGSSISAALGYAKARDIKGEDYSCIAVIGDGALTGGIAYEALNNAGAENTPLIVILNDNSMSIDENVGGIAEYLQKLRLSKGYLNFKEDLKSVLKGHPSMSRSLTHLRDAVKNSFVPGIFFEQMGFKYYGPVDGHDIELLSEVLSAAKLMKRPVIIHAVTIKGKGFVPAEKNPGKFHGVSPFNPSTATSQIVRSEDKYTDIFGAALVKEASLDDRIVGISAAMTEATGLCKMQEVYPKRVFDCAIAEQHAVSFAAGLALGGMKPVVAIYSTFLQRAYDQTLTEVCLQNLPVVFAIDRAGITGQDGETHHGAFDIAYLSDMPNMNLLAPKDGPELAEMLRYALSLDAPCAIRYPKGKAEYLSDYALPAGCNLPQQVRDGKYICIVAAGGCVRDALDAAEFMKERGIDCSVYNLRSLKPLNLTFLDGIFNEYRFVITLEDGIASGGVGTRIAAYAAERGARCAIKVMGWPDKFIEHGSISELKARYGMNARGIAETVVNLIEAEN